MLTFIGKTAVWIRNPYFNPCCLKAPKNSAHSKVMITPKSHYTSILSQNKTSQSHGTPSRVILHPTKSIYVPKIWFFIINKIKMCNAFLLLSALFPMTISERFFQSKLVESGASKIFHISRTKTGGALISLMIDIK